MESMMPEISKKENIKNLWSQLPNDGSKYDFRSLCAKEFNRSRKTIKIHWFSNSGDWSVPEDFQDRVIYLLQITISLKNTAN